MRSAGVDDTLNAIRDFINFLQELRQANHRSQDSPPALSPPVRSRRTESFLPGTTLHNLLTSIPGARKGVRSTQIQRSCRFACLVYINAVLLEALDDVDRAEQFLKRLSVRIIEQELDWNESTETLMWILLFGDEDAEQDFNQGRLTWWVGRILNVAKRLSELSWTEVGDLMLKCLTRSTVRNDFESWLSALRKELLLAPLSSHLGGV